MKNVVARGVAKAGLLAAMIVIAASVSANAQSLQYRLTANIPFDFSVAGKKLPAGKYWINRAQQGSGDMVVQISSTDGHSTSPAPTTARRRPGITGTAARPVAARDFL